MEQHDQRRIMMAIQPVDIDEIAIIEFPAFAPVRNERAGKQVWINRLGIASPQPRRGNVRSDGKGRDEILMLLDIESALNQKKRIEAFRDKPLAQLNHSSRFPSKSHSPPVHLPELAGLL